MVGALQKYREQFARALPFVLFRKPNATQVIGLRQPDQTLHQVQSGQEQGFVFAPFDGTDVVLLPSEKCEKDLIDFNAEPKTKLVLAHPRKVDEASKKNHIKLVERAIQDIKKGEIRKIVISRRETVPLTDFDFLEAFIHLATTYRSAMAYCFYHPQIGLWLGAFSEQLLFVRGNDFRTMSVAGTQVQQKGDKVVWGNKEREEQQWVTDFIISNLKPFASDLQVSEPYDLQAGNLVHIKTDIWGSFKDQINLMELLGILHPTPAVCGFPKQLARDFILQNEGYDRRYYSGFLGEFNHNLSSGENATDLYVNLRCVEIVDDIAQDNRMAHIYVGGGITADSEPEKEWIETVYKANTIEKILF